MISEGKAKICVKSNDKISKKLPVFYNPLMKLNRDVSVLLLQSISNKKMRIADPLAASGVRSIRLLLEKSRPRIATAFVNDGSAAAARNIKKNMALNKISERKAKTFNQDAGIFLLQNRPFDYIDVDPFGSPVAFLDPACRSLSRKGILAVTATDTAALSGSAPKACMRKYWSTPLRNHLMHEAGLRILIRRIQLAATPYEKALIPVYSYSKLHYMRVFLRCSNKSEDIQATFKLHNFLNWCNNCLSIETTSKPAAKCSKCKSLKLSTSGRLWSGRLWDEKTPAALTQNNADASNSSLLETISEESKINAMGFYDTHFLCKKLKISAPNLNSTISSLKKKGYLASRTHLNGNGIRTNAHPAVILKAIKKCTRQNKTLRIKNP